MTPLLDAGVPCHDVFQHLDACAPCAALLAFARNRRDLDALAAWRRQLTAHVAADHERRHFHEYGVAPIAAA